MDGKFLSDSTKDALIDIIDATTKLGVFEMVERPILRFSINQVDKYADKHIPDKYDDLINAACELALSGEYVEASGVCGEIIDDLVNFSNIDDNIEKLVFVDGLKFLVRQVQFYIEKKK